MKKICFDHALRRQPLLGSDFWDFSRMHILGLFRLKMALSRVQKFKESIASGLSRFGARLRELWAKIYIGCVVRVLLSYSQPLLVFSTPSCVTTLGMLVWHGHGGVGVGCARVWVCHGENVGVWLQWFG